MQAAPPTSAPPYRRLRAPPAPRGRRSPWIRAGLAGAVLAMLPFVWSENTSCDGKPQPLVTPLDILFGHGQLALGFLFLGLLLGSVAFAFLAARAQRSQRGMLPSRRWGSFVAEIVAGLAALATTTMCAMMMTYGRHDQPLDHPAAWVGTLAAFGIAMQSWFSSGTALRRAIGATRMRRRLRLEQQPSTSSGASRIAMDARAEERFELAMRAADEHAAAEEATDACGSSTEARQARRSVPRRA